MSSVISVAKHEHGIRSVTSTHNAHVRKTITLSCPAKVNLVLSVGPLNENRMHPLVSWMAAVDFSDTLTLSGVPNDAAEFDLQADTDVPPNDPRVEIDWPLDSDLVYRAHALLQAYAGRSLAVNLSLRKRIPAGAGLGGGSSNAAATLVALDQWFELGLDSQTLIGLGQQLGSDVGFSVGAMLGQTSALVAGVGDQIEPMPLAQPIHLVLIFPPLVCPTGPVYAAFDQLHHSHRTSLINPQQLRELANALPLAPEAPWNDLAEAAFVVTPELKTMASHLHQQQDRPIHVTGSGSTLYLIAPSRAAATDWAGEVSKKTGLPAVATQTLSHKS